MRRRAFAVTLTLVGLLILLPVASAHGYQVDSDPKPSARVAKSPTVIQLTMSDPIDTSQSHVRVFDIDGVDHAQGDLRGKDNKTHASVVFQNVSLPGDGTYTVAWDALWPDGHVTQGGYAFVVGNGSLANAFAAPKSSNLPLVDESIARGLGFIGWLLVAGCIDFALFVERPVMKRHPAWAATIDAVVRPRLWLGGMVGAACAFAAAVASFVLEARHTSFGWRDPLSFAAGTQVGGLLAARVGLALVAIVVAFIARRWRGGLIVLASVGLLGLASLTSVSHARDYVWLLPLDWIHLVAGATWLGLLLGLATSLRPMMRSVAPQESHDVLMEAADHVSALALTSVIILAITGTVAAVVQIGSVAAFFGTFYGRTLIVKISIFGVLIILGAVNRFHYIPGFRLRPDPKAGERFRRTVGIEVALVTLILLTTGVLTGAAPREAPSENGFVFRGHGRDIECVLRLDPGGFGTNAALLNLTDRHGRPFTDIDKVSLFLNPPPGSSLPRQFTTVFNQTGPIGFETNATFGVPGKWHVTIYVQRTGADDDAVEFDLPIPRPQEGSAAAT